MSLVVSLDMGSDKMAMALATYDNQGEVILQNVKYLPSHGIQNGTIVDYDKTLKCVQSMLKEIGKDVMPRQIQVALSGSVVIVKKKEVSINLPRQVVEERDLILADKQCEDAIEYKDEQLIDKMVISYCLDGDCSVTRPLGKRGHTLNVLYYQYISYREYILKLYSMFKELGFISINFVPQTRVYRETLNNELKGKCVAVVDLGDSSIKVALFKDTLIKVDAVLPIGVGTIDTDIQGAFMLSAEIAKHLKLNEGNALRSLCVNKKIIIPGTNQQIDSKDLSTVVQSRMEELLLGVVYVLQKSGFMEDLENILLTGGGRRLINVEELLHRLTDVRTDLATVSGIQVKKEDILNMPEFFVALGLLNCIEEEEEETPAFFSRVFKKLWK